MRVEERLLHEQFGEEYIFDYTIYHFTVWQEKQP